MFSARNADRSEPWSTNFDLYLASADGSGDARNLTAANKAWDAGPVFSADGSTLYYRAMKRPGFEADRFALMAMDLASGTTREIAPEVGPLGRRHHAVADGSDDLHHRRGHGRAPAVRASTSPAAR